LRWIRSRVACHGAWLRRWEIRLRLLAETLKC
jgi:hypothetical protein